MKITVDKCEQCGGLFENPHEFVQHLKNHQITKQFSRKYLSGVTEEGQSRQRDILWLVDFRNDILKNIEDIIKARYIPWSENFYRFMAETNHIMDRWCMVEMSVCKVCYKQYNQPYYASVCTH